MGLYPIRYRLPKLAFHADARADLEAVRKLDHQSASRIVALAQQVNADANLLDRLTQHDFGLAGTADFHVSRWESQQRKHGRNLWRLKLWDLENDGIRYRLIYAFQPSSHEVYVLGITPRRIFNYEDNDPFTKRVVACYDRHFSK